MPTPMPDADDLPALAAWVNETACELIEDVLRRHTEGLLKAVRRLTDERNAALAHIEALVEALDAARMEIEQLRSACDGQAARSSRA